MTGDQTYQFKVQNKEQGQRLDAFVPVHCKNLSRNACARLIRQGLVTVDKSVKKPSYVLKPGEMVSVTVPEPETADIVAQDMDLAILYEDRDIVAVNKPPGMVVHPAPGHSSNTLVNALLAHCKDLSGIGGVQRPGIVHRLDKETSGVILAAKNDAAHAGLSEQLAQRRVEKFYLALAHGVIKEDTGVIDLPLARHPSDRKRMHVSTPAKGREALSLWTVKERFLDATYVKVQIKTGRTHQIRVHLAALHHPVIGDTVYGGRKKRGRLPASVLGKAPPPERQMLHAHIVSFTHPVTGEKLTLTAPLPQDMAQLLEALRESPK
ncbi:pseudouridine synthase, RluA family [Desulfatibacillum aliphaticivorans]|uniref:Pseudouridine synthase n=1 Tax=Desulfatibacillum aliphaticivorans TaxID=218208 RepID=B8FLB4_DESAL|nr:RluA family pseudouridine synthase [Desulfatibacillum aliphaticivorans]ACL05060.1 pseudouridine synthase, RluA family [Desulfatibacillum aliphaticivorans]